MYIQYDNQMVTSFKIFNKTFTNFWFLQDLEPGAFVTGSLVECENGCKNACKKVENVNLVKIKRK